MSDILAERTGIGTPPNFNLAPHEMERLERGLLASYCGSPSVREDSVVSFVVMPDDPLADFARTVEEMTYDDYDSETAQEPYEDNSFFVLTADRELGRIAHIKRVVTVPTTSVTLDPRAPTGIEVFDDRIKAVVPEESASLQEIINFYNGKLPSEYWNITSNSAVPGIPKSIKNPYALISYKAIFLLSRQRSERLGIEPPDMVAYMNPQATTSLLGRLGVSAGLLLDREFHLPNPPDSSMYDTTYVAHVIPNDEINARAFTEVNPELRFTKLIADRPVPVVATAVSGISGTRTFQDLV